MASALHRPGLPRRSVVTGLPRRSVVAAGAAVPLATAALAACDGKAGGPGEGGGADRQAELPRADFGAPEGAGAAPTPFTARMRGATDRAATNPGGSPLSPQLGPTMAGTRAA